MKIRLTVVVLGSFAVCACEPRTSKGPIGEPTTYSVADTVLAIGLSDDREGHALFQVRGAVRNSSGRLYIADGGSGEIRGYDSDGALVATYGRTGAGPGEHRGLGGLWFAQGDTVVSYDGVAGKLIYWSSDGQPNREERVAAADQMIGGGIPGSSQYLQLTVNRPFQFPVGTSHHDSMTVSVSGSARAVRLGTFGYETRYAATLPTGGLIFTPLPLEPKASYAAGRKAIYVGDGSRWHVRIFAPTGEELAPIEPTVPRRPLTVEAREAWKKPLIEGMPVEQRPAMESYLAALPYSDSLPAYDALVVDEMDMLWIREFPVPGDSLVTWRVYAEEGRKTGELRLRVRERLFQVGDDFVVIGDTRADGAEMVMIRRLRRGG